MVERKFLAVEMLGSLARWLRIMGYDTSYARDMADNDILSQAQKEGRIILTRDRQLAERASMDGMFIQSDDDAEQLRQVIRRYALYFDEESTRCARCNGLLSIKQRSEVESRVPPRVLERQEEFQVCSLCGQIYWKGTHWRDIRKRIALALDRARVDNSPR